MLPVTWPEHSIKHTECVNVMYRAYLKQLEEQRYPNDTSDTSAGGTMVALKYVVFLGSVRENRLADRICKFLVSKLDEFNHEVAIMGEQIMVWKLS